jgi:hypothetical protein
MMWSQLGSESGAGRQWKRSLCLLFSFYLPRSLPDSVRDTQCARGARTGVARAT